MRNRQVFNGHRDHAFTLIEVLTSIGILSILLALLLPAAQQVREAARRARCANNLRQLVLATAGYDATYQVLPPLWTFSPDRYRNAVGTKIYRPSSYSLFTQILPNLDQANLYNRINFSAPLPDFYFFPTSVPLLPGFDSNATCIATRVETLVCPSDDRITISHGSTNYRANAGTERWITSIDGPFGDSQWRQCRTADILDGLSNTASFSEKLTGTSRPHSFDPRSDMIFGGLGLGWSVDQSIAACSRSESTSDPFFHEAGLTWFVGSLDQTIYNHTLIINSSVPDCVMPGSTTPSGLVGVRSNHPGGANVGFLDCSVKFIIHSIAPISWRAIGSRAGGEIVDF